MSHYDVSAGCQILYHLEQTPPNDPQYELLCRAAQKHINALKRAMTKHHGRGRPADRPGTTNCMPNERQRRSGPGSVQLTRARPGGKGSASRASKRRAPSRSTATAPCPEA